MIEQCRLVGCASVHFPCECGLSFTYIEINLTVMMLTFVVRLLVDEPPPDVLVTYSIPGHVGEAAQLLPADQSVDVMVQITLIHRHLPDRHPLQLNRVRSLALLFEVRSDRVQDRFLHPVELVLVDEEALAYVIGHGDDLPVPTVVEEHLQSLVVAIDAVNAVHWSAVVVGSVIEQLGKEG